MQAPGDDDQIVASAGISDRHTGREPQRPACPPVFPQVAAGRYSLILSAQSRAHRAAAIAPGYRAAPVLLAASAAAALLLLIVALCVPRGAAQPRYGGKPLSSPAILLATATAGVIWHVLIAGLWRDLLKSSLPIRERDSVVEN